MPPTASRVSSQFEPTTATGIGDMVICIHCQHQKLAKNNLRRKEEHLRICPSFSLSPIATERDANGRTMLEDSIATRAGRTKPGNLRAARGPGGMDGRELQRLQRLGAALAYGSGGNVQEGIQERVERILRGESSRGEGVSGGAYQQRQQQQQEEESPDLDDFQTFDTPSSFANGVARESETMAALLESATRNTTAVATNNDARKRTLPSDIHDSPSISQHLNNLNDNTRNTPHSMNVGQNKRLKHAELYLDEDDFDFNDPKQQQQAVSIMDDLLQFDGTMFQEDESLRALGSRVDPRFDPANAALKATCGHPPIHIHSQDDDASPNETTVFNILVELVDIRDGIYDKNVSANEAAVAINNLYLSERPDPTTRRTGSEGFLYLIWSELFTWVRQIPFEHSAMHRLVDLIAELMRIDVQTLHIWGQDIKLWSQLPLLNPEFVEECEQRRGIELQRLEAFKNKLAADGVYALRHTWKQN
ncbi:hypothetical protein E4T39_00211 [Aureobasidium subglaciale]|nr:hypothetical protein E4T39_00211 [Aureobasidium subglaciale]